MLVTAAHCVPGADYAEVGPDEVLIQIIEKVEHPDWNPDLPFDSPDYAVLKLEFESSESVIDLNSDSAIPEDTDDMIAIGFGRTSNGGPLADVLQQVVIPYVPNDLCNALRKPLGFGSIDEDIMMCIGDVDQGGKQQKPIKHNASTYKFLGGLLVLSFFIFFLVFLHCFISELAPCSGDSGSAVIDKNGKLAGIVSFGPTTCAFIRLPSVAARVSGEYDWLTTQICCMSDSTDLPSYCDSILPTCDPTCIDLVNDWHDSFSTGYTCDAYGETTELCTLFGDIPNYGYTANEVCCTCGGGIDPLTETPLELEDICTDLVDNWYDQFGITCSGYAEIFSCQNPDAENSTDVFFGYAQTEACCACGGGSPWYTGEILEQFCADIVPEGEDEWYDIDGPEFNCFYYASNEVCEDLGDDFENFGLTANE